MKPIKAGVIGASGYAGAELVRLLLMHPYAELTAISSQSYTGRPVSYTHLDVYKRQYHHLMVSIIAQK